ncbi:hypothetical protein NEAUS05_0540 [Nematocida ausubeli]|nr:hypothetical protein NEAUS07_0500 [Nematocida ausubeli]KAI5134194.1 hypothetical protein NEAUS06_0972 [Nematocida ausubeli]KAI5147221.1 hypothetical protein NEAUS05_0540 [Nematocida ausubeli]
MTVTEVVKRIELAEEFEFDEAALSSIEAVALASDEEFVQVTKALFNNYWGLPKFQKQEKWGEFVLSTIEKREDRCTFYAHLMERLRENWAKLDIRLKEKFVVLLRKLIKKRIEHSGAQIETFIAKGPDAEFDWPVMQAVIESKESLSEQETEYLLAYLIKHADTYFTNFFIKHVVPILKRDGVSQEIADRAYSEGSTRRLSPKMKELLYSVHACARD